MCISICIYSFKAFMLFILFVLLFNLVPSLYSYSHTHISSWYCPNLYLARLYSRNTNKFWKLYDNNQRHFVGFPHHLNPYQNPIPKDIQIFLPTFLKFCVWSLILLFTLEQYKWMNASLLHLFRHSHSFAPDQSWPEQTDQAKGASSSHQPSAVAAASSSFSSQSLKRFIYSHSLTLACFPFDQLMKYNGLHSVYPCICVRLNIYVYVCIW